MAIADTDIDKRLKIALLPGEKALLEDLLIISGVNYKTVSNRYLQVQNIDYYDIIAIGTGAHRDYPGLPRIDGKLKQFMEFGGTVLVFGQPGDWRDDILPVSIIPTEKVVGPGEVKPTGRSHRLFSQSFQVDIGRLLERGGEFTARPASVFPGTSLLTTDRGASLLAEAEFGKGRLIYCGLPLLEMVHALDPEAIKFFTNIINYSGR